LVLDGALDEATAREALDKATAERKQVAAYLREHKLVTAAQMAAAHSIEFGMPIFGPSAMAPAQRATRLISRALLGQRHVLRLEKRGNKLFVGMADPADSRALDEVKFHTNLVVEPILIDEDSIRRTLELWMQSNDTLTEVLGDADDLDNLDVEGG